ncbi:OmpA family protein [Burkholderia ambifaria]|uniref:OmpA/MotB domain protein n=1 Tax=Burkholderia ambifaria MEX-5 TaxID=396597 RepID=B1TGF8_9BURK|nr:OmpA family protein [Burkholderia ambifaria]EDT37347.1 OmpA/MotB domain protein [Burkholderia ambifaria MEX-5]
MSTTTTGVLLATVLVAGCTAASGPTYSAYSVALPDGAQAYRVTCYGLLEGPGACRKEAASICKDQTVTVLEAQSGLGATSSGQPDDRSLLFRCGAPTVAAAPVAQQPSPAPSPPALTTLDADTNFDTDRADLTPIARDRLDRLISASRGVRVRTVTVNGYTDSVGSDDYNVGLSERRASAVDAYLQSHGLSAGRFVGRGYGKADPVDSNETAVGRARNRRVEVRLDVDRP